jgi:predicted transcriptional regulator
MEGCLVQECFAEMTKQVNRSNFCRVFDVVQKVREYSRLIITHIAQKSNMSYSDASDIVHVLVRANILFIEEANNKKLYTLTPKGHEFYKDMLKMREYHLPEEFF